MSEKAEQVQNAARPHEIEQARRMELLRKVRVTRQGLAGSLAEIKGGRPDTQYSWCNRSEQRLNYFHAQGYAICTDKDVVTQWKREDGTHVRGDLILVCRPKDLHEAWKFDSELRAVADLEGSRDSFKAFAGQHGIPVDEPR